MATSRFFHKGKTPIGLSLSWCIDEMIRFKISEEDVTKIVAGTNAPDEQTFKQVLKQYAKIYWADFPEEAKALALRLYTAGKIEQPRTEGKPCHTIADGKWAESMDDIRAW